MEGVTLMPTEKLDELIDQVRLLQEVVTTISKTNRIVWLTIEEAAAHANYSEKWVREHKERIGFTDKGGKFLIKLSDLDNYLHTGYFKQK